MPNQPMTTHSIIFTADEVRDTLAGTMTRFMREVKPSRYCHVQYKWYMPHSGGGFRAHNGNTLNKIPELCEHGFPCPFGTVGDQLIVKETWGYYSDPRGVFYKASFPKVVRVPLWRSPVTMPRWASRITLEITGVSVEQVNGVWMWAIDYRRMK